MDAFVFVRPTGKPFSEALGTWAREQADYAISEWVHFFRGEPRVKNDTDVTAADIAAVQPRALRRSVEQRRLQEDRGPAADSVARRWRRGRTGRSSRPPTRRSSSSPIRCNPTKYVVINSGFTFHDQSNNDMQSPKLPDWAVVDITKPGNNYRYLPLFVESQGFFDEGWKLKGPARACRTAK